MIELVVSANDFDHVRDTLIRGDTEECAILFASQTERADKTVRLLVREVQIPVASDYSRKGRLAGR
jgi:hypothetical protein